MAQSQIAQPLGGATVSGTLVTVDTYVNPPTKIPSRIAALAATNMGYFAETILATPGISVQGGAVLYEVLKPTDLFLPSDQGLAPRAPGAEAPRLGAVRPEPLVARPESWSGSIEVTDEARRRNDVILVANQFTRAANSITNAIQETLITELKAFVEAQSRQVESPANWITAPETKNSEVKASAQPFSDFALIERKFLEDKAGVLPDTIIIHPKDWARLLTTYSGVNGIQGGARAVLQEFGISNVVRTVLAPEGAPYFVKAGQLGFLLFEQGVTQEKEREAIRKTDSYIIEVNPVIVLNEPAAVWQLTKINE